MNIFKNFWGDLNIKYRINWQNIVQILKHAMWLGVAAALTYLTDYLNVVVTGHDFGNYTPIVLMGWSMLIRAFNTWKSGIER